MVWMVVPQGLVASPAFSLTAQKGEQHPEHPLALDMLLSFALRIVVLALFSRTLQ